jgi:PadR family transcriptional regulator, regulatory protein PadR
VKSVLISVIEMRSLGDRDVSLIERRRNVSKPNELVQGTLDLLILKIVNLEPMHGFGIAQRLKQMSSDVLTVSQGSLYPALYKLEQEGWVRAEWKETESKRQAKFYSITAAGRKRLQKEAENWERLSGAISAIVNLEGWEGA